MTLRLALSLFALSALVLGAPFAHALPGIVDGTSNTILIGEIVPAPPEDPPAASFDHSAALQGSARVRGDDFQTVQKFSLHVSFDESTFLAVDGEGHVYTGHLSPKGTQGTKFQLFLDEGSEDAFSAEVAGRAADASGRAAGNVLGRSSRMILKLRPDGTGSLKARAEVLFQGVGGWRSRPTSPAPSTATSSPLGCASSNPAGSTPSARGALGPGQRVEPVAHAGRGLTSAARRAQAHEGPGRPREAPGALFRYPSPAGPRGFRGVPRRTIRTGGTWRTDLDARPRSSSWRWPRWPRRRRARASWGPSARASRRSRRPRPTSIGASSSARSTPRRAPSGAASSTTRTR
jgi:hypothetical protein